MTNVLVTGGEGFIGSEVVKKLLKKGYAVRVADNLSKKRKKTGNGYEFVNIDLTDKEKTKNVFKNIDVCIHLAAKIGGIGYFNKFPGLILSENNKLYSSVFESAVKSNIKRMVYISSSMVFESATTFPSKESDISQIPMPKTAYGFSKLIGEMYCKAFRDEYKLPYSICRPFNAYGINEYPQEEVGYAHVIPDLMKKILSGQYPLRLLGNGQQVRSFTHVSDLADGIIMVMESKKAVNEDFNIAHNQPVTIQQLAELLWKLTEQKKTLKIKYVAGFAGDVKKRVPDTKKIEKIIGWKAKVSLEDGLEETIAWLQKNI